MNPKELASKLALYCLRNGYELDRGAGEVNIIYLEGSNADGTPNADRADRWNDRRIVLLFNSFGAPYMATNHAATTEPGWAATIAAKAKKLGGVARIAFGQQQSWKVGFHKGKPDHPSLVQCSPVFVHRDKNQDGKRTGDIVTGASGINQHGTKPGWHGSLVGLFSEGCLVGWLWTHHMAFMRLVMKDPRYIADKDYVFKTTVLPGDVFYAEMGA